MPVQLPCAIIIVVSAASITALRQLAFRICADRLASMRIERCGKSDRMRASVYLTRDDNGVLTEAVRSFFPDAIFERPSSRTPG
jgi:hypothetical protein